MEMQLNHLLLLIDRHRSHVTADGIEGALKAILDGGKAEAVLPFSHPDFPPTP
jgi:hypothetical protein